MKYVSGRIVWGIYTWLGWSGEVAEPIRSSVPVGQKQKLNNVICTFIYPRIEFRFVRFVPKYLKIFQIFKNLSSVKVVFIHQLTHQ